MASNYSCLIENVSVDSLTLSEWTPQGNSFYNSYIVIIVNALFSVIGTPLNASVIIRIIKRHRSTEPTMMLLLSLTIADLLMCALILPITVLTGIADNFIFGDTDYVRCQVCQMGLLTSILLFASLNTLALISVDRFVYIWRPLRYNRYMTIKTVRSLIIAAWLLSIAVSVTPLFGFGTYFFSKILLTCTLAFGGYSGSVKNTWYLLLLILVAMLPIVTLIVTNVWVFCIALKSTRKHFKMRNVKKYIDGISHKVNQEKNKRQLKLIKVFIAILLTNVVTWIPILMLFISRLVHDPDASFPTDARVFLITFSNLTLLSQSVLHPIIESRTLFSTKQRISSALRRISGNCHCIDCCCCGDGLGQCCGTRCVLLEICNAAFLPTSDQVESSVSVAENECINNI